ncbi:MAG: phosphatase PAP2 family protein [Alphaproteobacteria bacterium]|nr:phosphatase PAP2 family protein [Alphaproteobacteria bacterium]MBV9373323.1 phosphatase PAP2 family protein [Alphaproteobacteria bacterium]MBV9900312.1 phosphatase PAP2 family protein [Alphaproteobacteria bacterium]
MPPKPFEVARAVLDADAAATAAARSWRGGGTVLECVADLGDQPAMRILCGAVIAAGIVAGDRRLASAGVRMLAAHTLATLAKDAVKRRVDRTRPRSTAKPGKDHRPAPGGSEAKEETSFPSGHSAGAVAVGRALARDYPALAAPAYGTAALLALVQIPRRAHYPSDVAAGAAIGLAAEAVVDLAFGAATRALDARGRSAEPEPPPILSAHDVVPIVGGFRPI